MYCGQEYRAVTLDDGEFHAASRKYNQEAKGDQKVFKNNKIE
jgi:hypothetical protein